MHGYTGGECSHDYLTTKAKKGNKKEVKIMKIILFFFLFAFLLIEFTSTNSFAQTFEERAKHQIDSVNDARAKLSKDEQKISSPIYKMLIDYERTLAAGKTKTEAFQKFKGFSLMTDNSERI